MNPSPPTLLEVAPSGPYHPQPEFPWNWAWELPRCQADAAISLGRRCEESPRRAHKNGAPNVETPSNPPAPTWGAGLERSRTEEDEATGLPTTLAAPLRAVGKGLDAESWQQVEAQLRQTQKLEALGALAGGIAHDFNNVLTAILSFAELARLENPDNAGLQGHLRQIQLAGNRAAGLVNRILSFSRKQKPERRPVQLGAVIGEALELLRSTLPRTVVIRECLDRGLPDVLADATQIHQVLLNLATNAAHAMRGGQGRLTVELRLAPQANRIPPPNVELRPRDYLQLTISDTGHGMDEATLRRLFEPFFTTKAPGEGTGLGLAMVHGILQDHEGTIAVTSKVGVGTTFHLYLPAADRAADVPAEQPKELPRGHGERILFVDDEPALCKAATRMLGYLGYEVVSFRDPGEARHAFERDAAGFHAVVTDHAMPEMTGLDLAKALLARRPEVPVILCSGQDCAALQESVRQVGIREVLQKPMESTSLATAIHRVLRPPA